MYIVRPVGASVYLASGSVCIHLLFGRIRPYFLTCVHLGFGRTRDCLASGNW